MLANVPRQEYSREDVRRLLGISEQQLRGWEKQGLIPRATRFLFSDLIALRTLQKLRENRIPAQRIIRAIESLKSKLAGIERPLSELKIVSDGRTIAVQIAGQKMEAISGQMLFDFETAELGSLATLPARSKPTRVSAARQAELLFQQGLALEESGAPIEEAIAAYREAVELNPAAAGAWVNLGTICFRQNKLAEAERHYHKALEAEHDYALAHFNLGNLYDEQGRLGAARECYLRALKLKPNYADAHFNLALLCEKTGDSLKAVYHWKAYLKLDGTSSWADIARRELERLRRTTLIHSR